MPAASTPDAARGPESHPLRSLGLGALVTASPAAYLYGAGDVSVPSVLAGLLVSLVAVGPAAGSSLGRRAGARFRGIGVAGRVAVITAVAAAAFAASFAVRPPIVPMQSAILGAMVGLDGYVVYRILSDRLGGD